MDSIRQALGQLEQELRSREQEVARLKAGVAALRQILDGAPATQASASGASSSAGEATAQQDDESSTPAPAPDSPRGREAVRRVLEERVGQWVNMDELTNEIVARRWVSSSRPREAVRTSADRLVGDDPLVDKGRGGIYRLRGENADRLQLDGEPQEGGEEHEDART